MTIVKLAFVIKLDPDATTLLGGTFLGGSEVEYGFGVTVDDSGRIYVTGHTYSDNFPTTGTPIGKYKRAFRDAFLSVFNPDLTTLLYSTFLGGDLNDSGYGLDVDYAGNIFVTGETSSDNFPTTPGAFLTTHIGGACGTDAFVCKIKMHSPTKVIPAVNGLLETVLIVLVSAGVVVGVLRGD